MSNLDLFYICGIGLAISALLVGLVGLRLKSFPGKAMPLVLAWFGILVVCTTTFAVLHAKDEDKAKAAEFTAKGESIETAESSPVPKAEGAAPSKPPGTPAPVKGPGGTLKLSASPTQIAFNTTKLTSKPGKVTIDFNNPAPIEHDVAIEQNGKEIAKSELIKESSTSVSAELAPGTYTFLCTVPGHAEAGMEGTLVVK
jgi:plastocyanin